MTREEQVIGLLQQREVDDGTRRASGAVLYGRGASDRIYTFLDTLCHAEMLAAKLIELARELDRLSPLSDVAPVGPAAVPQPPTPEERYLRATTEIDTIKWGEPQ